MSQGPETLAAPAQLLAHNELGQIHVEASGVVTLKINYLSLRLQSDAFDALTALVRQAATELAESPSDQSGIAPHSETSTWH